MYYALVVVALVSGLCDAGDHGVTMEVVEQLRNDPDLPKIDVHQTTLSQAELKTVLAEMLLAVAQIHEMLPCKETRYHFDCLHIISQDLYEEEQLSDAQLADHIEAMTQSGTCLEKALRMISEELKPYKKTLLTPPHGTETKTD